MVSDKQSFLHLNLNLRKATAGGVYQSWISSIKKMQNVPLSERPLSSVTGSD